MKKGTLQEVYRQLRECLEAVKPGNVKLSGAMQVRLNYNIEFLKLFIQLQGDSNSDVQAIGFYEDQDEEEPDGEKADEINKKAHNREAGNK